VRLRMYTFSGGSANYVCIYSTSAMADDAITLLNYVGWTSDRDLHVVGVSLGGMIAQGESPQYSPPAAPTEKRQRTRTEDP
jgi:hypothetical protein